MTTISEKVLHFRTLNDLSQADLGKKIEEITGESCDRHAISRYENGKRKIPVNYVPVLARIFGISTDELFFSSNELKQQHSDTRSLEVQIAEFKELAATNSSTLSMKALEIIDKAKAEIQDLKGQVKTWQKDAQKYKDELENIKPVIKKIGKYIEQMESFTN
ncbi:helix-turn-helix transcriptional regulator [Fulvivirga ulvae]|uniref:helix-turn-helix transcriptional regulator n=1 Tax=Fulvivirga ulvae TaxID=2904245 RepID=UPI001F27783C|nr:helix-turn-helix transcriptional regulator [Fulvivirga ulvae]UII32208.1 helix-turn-helix transcriptional regulator [Fulvivirga ulvae]UII32241.1 helix-turn-helix transcriptional regulator [Fulvivirga ulvae]